MYTITFEIDDGAAERLQKLAQGQGRALEELIQDAITDRLEELEDYPIVTERLATLGENLSHEEVMTGLGLDETVHKG